MGIILIVGYILVPIAFVDMFMNYRQSSWLWAAFLALSIFLGIAPFIAFSYLVSTYLLHEGKKPVNSNVTYPTNGSYTVYKADNSQSSPSTGQVAFRVVGGLLAGVCVAFGLLVSGLVLLVILAPSIACGGSSKCY